MAGDLNRVTIIGRLTRDPELKYIQSGTAVTNFSIANNRNYTTNSGEKKEEVSYFDCIAWGKMGEILAEYCKKGRRIALEGRLQQRRWEDQEGNKKSKIEIVTDNIQFLDGKPSDQAVSGLTSEGSQQPGSNENPFSDDNIPF
ncbi:MAG: single-stranded DNA-binding protein [Spirochaetes bacterium]|nr:single-stranded DNA-binding protein [Spirochaetota bacterium]